MYCDPASQEVGWKVFTFPAPPVRFARRIGFTWLHDRLTVKPLNIAKPDDAAGRFTTIVVDPPTVML